MQEQEGVIKYQLHHQQHALGANIDLQEINVWRTLLFQLKLIGQRADKYGGLAFGNISQRLIPGNNQFVISGSQTGQLTELNPEHYVLINNAESGTNTIDSSGLFPPSSEALTHASVYQHQPAIQVVIHVHSPSYGITRHIYNYPIRTPVLLMVQQTWRKRLPICSAWTTQRY